MKAAKTPPITENTKLLCFDVETNGLHGQAFAIGAVVIDVGGKIQDEFTARIKIAGLVDSWVKKNVMPVISDMKISHISYKDMCDSFWKWFVVAQGKSDYALVSNGYPVEYRFLLDCQNGAIESRYWEHPFPLIDLPSLLLGLGQLSETSKGKLAAEATKDETFSPHHPLHDAKVSALTAILAFRQAGLIN